MNLDWSADDIRFRAELREWLNANAPQEARPHDTKGGEAFDRAWQRRLFEAGWAGVNWPVAYGGRGLTLLQQVIWYEEYARAKAPGLGFRFVSLNHAGPTLIAKGSEQQKQHHLPRILSGDELWCQGFSEPGSGSDLASLTTRGEIDGDHLVVNGQKIWTSGAEVSDVQELLIRTDPEQKRHKGLTWVICPMDAPGIEVHPIKKLTGEADFCSVFYTDVRIPLANIVGQVNEGWGTALATLGFERGTAYMPRMAEVAVKLHDLKSHAQRQGLWGDDHFRTLYAQCSAEVAALRAMNYANVSRYFDGAAPGAEGSLLKLFSTDVARSVYELGLLVGGADVIESAVNEWTYPFLHNFSSAIGGGTSEIQREIVAGRVLNLPRSR